MGTGSDWHWALECSPLLINHNQSSAITSISFGQLLWRSGGAALLGSLWYVGTAETSGAAILRRENKNKMVTKKKPPCAPESLQASHYKRWGFSNYFQPVLCAACEYKQEGEYTCTRWNLQPFPICENEIQVHNDNTRLWLQPPAVKTPRPAAQAIKVYSPKFPFNNESENENIIFSQADGNCCFFMPDV